MKHHDTEIRRHIKVFGGNSQVDGDWIVLVRLGKNQERSKRVKTLLKR